MTTEELIQRKRALGYTNEMIAELSGVPLGTVQKIFSGITKAPRYSTLHALEQVLRNPEDDDTRRTAPAAQSGFSNSGYDIPELSFPADGLVREPSAVYEAYKTGSAEKKPGEYTLDDYLALPPERRVELIDGVFYDMAAPGSAHQILAFYLCMHLAAYVTGRNGSCMPMISPLDVRLDCDDKTVVQPDVIVICDRSKITRAGITGAPDLVIEILSPSTRKKDMFLKLNKYLNAGVREYWMVDPERKQVIVYDFDHDDYPLFYSFEDQVPVGIFDGACRIDFAELYEQIRFLDQ